MTDTTFSAFVPFSKFEEQPDGTLMVFGRATQEIRDSANEIMDYETSVPFFQRRSQENLQDSGGSKVMPLRAMHQNIAAGNVLQFDFLEKEKAIDMATHVVDPVEITKVRNHVYTGFSVGGKYARRWPDGGSMRYTADPREISLVDAPAVPTAKFTLFKVADGEDIEKGDLPGHEFHGNQYTEGQKVKIKGDVEGKGKKGTISQIAPSGKYYGVQDKKGNHIGYYHESDIEPVVEKSDGEEVPEEQPEWVDEYKQAVVDMKKMKEQQQADQDLLLHDLKSIGERVGISFREGSLEKASNRSVLHYVEYGDPANSEFLADASHYRDAVMHFNKGLYADQYSATERHILGRRLAAIASRFGDYTYDPALTQIKEPTIMTYNLNKLDVGAIVAGLKAQASSSAAVASTDPHAALASLMGYIDGLSTGSPISGQNVPVKDPSAPLGKADLPPEETPAKPKGKTPEAETTPVAEANEAVSEPVEEKVPEVYKALDAKIDAVADNVAKVTDSINQLLEGLTKRAPVTPAADSPVGALNALVNGSKNSLPGLDETEAKIVKALDEGGPYALIKALNAAGANDETGGALAWQTLNNTIRKATYESLEQGGVITASRYAGRLYQRPQQ